MKTHVCIVLDKSGSMSATKDATVVGYNEQVQQLKENAKNGQEILVSLVTFNGEVFEHLWEVPADQLTEASAVDYLPSGSTAMCDAMCYVIEKYQNTTDQNEEGAAYLLITITDGETNSDKHFSSAALKKKIGACDETKKWTFTMIGCGADYLKRLTEEIGIQAGNVATWDNTTVRGTYGSMKKMSSNSRRYFDERAKGVTSVCAYTTTSGADLTDNSDITDGELLSKGLSPDDLATGLNAVVAFSAQQQMSTASALNAAQVNQSALPIGDLPPIGSAGPDLCWGDATTGNATTTSNVFGNGKVVGVTQYTKTETTQS